MQQSVITFNKKYSYLVVFSVAVALRLIPEIIAYPYPIGYDVINYYLPILKNFHDFSTAISNQFPLYVSLLHTISSALQVDPRIVITSSVVLIFGLSSLIIFSIAKNLLHLDDLQSMFLSMFVIFQFSVLRTSWDLHKDLFAITLTFFCLSYISKTSNYSKKMIAVIVPLSILSVLADRMIGFLLSLSLVVSSIMRRDKILASIAIFITIVYGYYLIANFDTISTNLELVSNKDKISEIYNPVNLIVLFLVLNAALLPTGIIGLLKSKINVLKIPLFISLVASFSWIVFPNTSAFLPDRWITIFSIFLSLFSGYGFVLLIEKGYIAVSSKKLNNYLVILIPFIFVGSAFAMGPNNSYLNIYGVFHPYISQYGPLTMQYNSISLPESRSLLSVIDWINNNTNTPEGSVIIGSKHLRGWMKLELKERTFLFADNNTRLLESNKYNELYLLESNSKQATEKPENYLQTLSHNNTDFSLYQLKRIE